jgi:hypothetical protein
MRIFLTLFALVFVISSSASRAAEDVIIETCDGVKLRGTFHPAAGMKAKERGNACIIMLHPYGKDYSKNQGWIDLAKKMSGDQGFNVLSLEFRFTGKPNDISSDIFWKDNFNQRHVQGFGKKPPRTELSNKDVKSSQAKDYYPMLVNDVMAARVYLDSMNDAGKVNTSTVYLIGAGDAATIGFFYMTAEWFREREVPNVPVPPQTVSAARNLFPGAQACGRDIAGAIFLSPQRHPSFPSNTLETFVRERAKSLRTETNMLFLNGENDPKGKEGSKFFFEKVLVGNSKSTSLPKLTQTFHREIKGSKFAEAELLGKGLDTETNIINFIDAIEKERKTKVNVTRKYSKPLQVILQDFGVGLNQ